MIAADMSIATRNFIGNCVAPHIQTEIRYLNMKPRATPLDCDPYSNVFRAEREISLSGRKTRPADPIGA